MTRIEAELLALLNLRLPSGHGIAQAMPVFQRYQGETECFQYRDDVALGQVLTQVRALLLEKGSMTMLNRPEVMWIEPDAPIPKTGPRLVSVA